MLVIVFSAFSIPAVYQHRVLFWSVFGALIMRAVFIFAGLEGGRFTVMRNGRRYATPLLLALIAVEVTDLIFAVDSMPAIFAVTHDPFIVFTSKVFAILGLRSLYFSLAGIISPLTWAAHRTQRSTPGR